MDLQNAQTAKRALEKEINKTETDREKATKEKDLCRAELEALQKKVSTVLWLALGVVILWDVQFFSDKKASP